MNERRDRLGLGTRPVARLASEHDERCWEGVVPVECRSASCGTCWIGVLGGRGKAFRGRPPRTANDEVFGYNQPEDEKPISSRLPGKGLRQRDHRDPAWNGVFGKKIYGNVEELELEPVTTSAKSSAKRSRLLLRAKKTLVDRLESLYCSDTSIRTPRSYASRRYSL